MLKRRTVVAEIETIFFTYCICVMSSPRAAQRTEYYSAYKYIVS